MSFFSDLAFAFAGLGLGFVAGFGEAFATSVFLGVGFGIGFGVIFALSAGVALGFAGVAVAVGFGVAVGNSISLFAVVTTGFSSASFILFRLAGFSAQWVAALVMATPVFPIRLPRDLPRHPTTRCSLDSMMASLPHSSGSVPR